MRLKMFAVNQKRKNLKSVNNKQISKIFILFKNVI